MYKVGDFSKLLIMYIALAILPLVEIWVKALYYDSLGQVVHQVYRPFTKHLAWNRQVGDRAEQCCKQRNTNHGRWHRSAEVVLRAALTTAEIPTKHHGTERVQRHNRPVYPVHTLAQSAINWSQSFSNTLAQLANGGVSRYCAIAHLMADIAQYIVSLAYSVTTHLTGHIRAEPIF